MKNMTMMALAVAGASLVCAPAAAASEDAFLAAIDSLEYYAINCPGCAEDALGVGYRVCAAFGSGGESAAIAEVLKSYNGPGQTHPEYYATLFAQYSAYELCPQHNGKIDPI